MTCRIARSFKPEDQIADTYVLGGTRGAVFALFGSPRSVYGSHVGETNYANDFDCYDRSGHSTGSGNILGSVSEEERVTDRTPWYFVEDGTSRGPVSRPELEQLFRENALDADTLVWCPDLDGWQRSIRIDELRAIVRATPPPLPDNPSGIEVSLEERVEAAHRAHAAKSSGSSEPHARRPDFGAAPPAPPTETSSSPNAEQQDRSGVGASTDANLGEEHPAESEDEGTHAWRRFFARQLDYLMWGLPGGFLLGYMIGSSSPDLAQEAQQYSAALSVDRTGAQRARRVVLSTC